MHIEISNSRRHYNRREDTIICEFIPVLCGLHNGVRRVCCGREPGGVWRWRSRRSEASRLALNWVRLAPNATNLGLFKMFSSFWIGKPKEEKTDLEVSDLSHWWPICQCVTTPDSPATMVRCQEIGFLLWAKGRVKQATRMFPSGDKNTWTVRPYCLLWPSVLVPVIFTLQCDCLTQQTYILCWSTQGVHYIR